MSQAQKEMTSLLFSWFMKGMAGIAAFLMVVLFTEIRNDIAQTKVDVLEIKEKNAEDFSEVKERISKIEGKMTK